MLAANDDIANAVITVLKGSAHLQVSGDRPGRRHRGPAAHPQGRPVHDDLQGRQQGGRRGRQARDRAESRARTRPRSGQTLADFQDPKGNRTLKSVLLTPQVDHQGQRQGRHQGRRAHRGADLQGHPERLHSGRHQLDPLAARQVSHIGWPGAIVPATRSRQAVVARVRTRVTCSGLRHEREDVVAEPILQIKGLNKSFGPVHVLHDVDFSVYPGEVTALVGDNGAGKSTLVKCIAGINTIDSGESDLAGQAGHAQRPARRVRARHRVRLPGPRPRRQPRHHPEHVPGPRDQPLRVHERRRDGAQGPRGAQQPLGPHRQLGAPAGGQPLRRPAPDRRHRQGRPVEQQGRLPRRAHRRPRRRADPSGPRPRPPSGRPRPRASCSSRTT